MNLGYIAICYMCNEKCRFCPYAKETFKGEQISLFELKKIADAMKKEQQIDTITISGGEPTLHSELWNFVNYLNMQGISVVLLTNGERFAEQRYMEIVENVLRDKDKLTIITTIHSHRESEHEFANQTPGSLRRTVKGLRNMEKLGVHIIIKHCITKLNYQGLIEFYNFVDGNFADNIDIQLCSIDYCGMNQKEAEEEKLDFIALKPYIEEMFDKHIYNMENGSNRKMYCINMPLCSSDPYYWRFYVPRSGEGYIGYANPGNDSMNYTSNHIKNNVFPAAAKCNECKVFDLCPGTYVSAFEYFSDDLVKPYMNI